MIKKENPQFTKKGWEPIYRVYKEARILIVGQAPGIKTQERNEVFLDQSGDRLRAWMGVDADFFYNSKKIAVLPMDFYYPGKAKTGDLPPRKGFADRWHPLLLKEMPNLELIILVGNYAVQHYLSPQRNLTETVRAFETYLPKYFPLVHPSPLNRRWEAKNPWFETEVLPKLKASVIKAIKED